MARFMLRDGNAYPAARGDDYVLMAVRLLLAIVATIFALAVMLAPSPLSEVDPWRAVVVFSLFVVGAMWLGRLSDRRLRPQIAVENERVWRDLVEAKNHFIDNVSHGLKTPLTGIVGFAQLLEDSLDDPHQREWVAMILEGSAELSHTLDNLLIAARLAAGRLDIQLNEVWVGDVIGQAMSALSMPGANIHAGCEDARLMVDPELFAHILRNLLVNAHQHGRLPIGVRGYLKSGRYFVEISDAGPGIPRRRESWIFERFTGRSGTGIRGEVGLGLWIAGELSEIMDCAMSYRRHTGRSYFIVSVPLAQ